MKHVILCLTLFGICGAPLGRADEAPALAAASAALSPPASAVPVPAAPAAPASTAAITNARVRVVTNIGSFVIEVNAERAPLSVLSFLRYVDQGQYTGTIFHRVIANFVIQGGGYDTNYKLKPATRKVVNESGNGVGNTRGTVGMARTGEPHGADCQFYVNLSDNGALDPNVSRWGYAVFGRVVDGMEIVDRIGNTPTGSHPPFKEDTPSKPIVIERIERMAP